MCCNNLHWVCRTKQSFAPIAIERPFYGTMSYDVSTLVWGDLSGFGCKYYSSMVVMENSCIFVLWKKDACICSASLP